jgi:hypothetical protein
MEENRFLRAYQEHMKEKDTLRPEEHIRQQNIANAIDRFACLKDYDYRSRADRNLDPYRKPVHSQRIHLQPVHKPITKLTQDYPTLPYKSMNDYHTTLHVLPKSTLPPILTTSTTINTGMIVLSLTNQEAPKPVMEIETTTRAYKSWADVLKK